MIETIAAAAKAVAGISLRKLIHLRTRSKRLASGASRICLRTLRAKNGETSGAGTRPRISHNFWSSSGFIFLPKIKLPLRMKVAQRTSDQYSTFTFPALPENLRAAESGSGAASCEDPWLRFGVYVSGLLGVVDCILLAY